MTTPLLPPLPSTPLLLRGAVCQNETSLGVFVYIRGSCQDEEGMEVGVVGGRGMCVWLLSEGGACKGGHGGVRTGASYLFLQAQSGHTQHSTAHHRRHPGRQRGLEAIRLP